MANFTEVPYDREKAVAYAREWALKRNPRYMNFAGIGGDCTNFISQCLFAGGAVPNYSRWEGWYYNSPQDRAPAWSSVEYFYKFILNNVIEGPYAFETAIGDMEPGDVIQLATTSNVFHHTVIITDTGENPAPENIMVCAHSYDSLERPLNTYDLRKNRYLHILGSRRLAGKGQ